jgi:hypothetical protein
MCIGGERGLFVQQGERLYRPVRGRKAARRVLRVSKQRSSLCILWESPHDASFISHPAPQPLRLLESGRCLPPPSMC